ncbi:MAG: polysaccharide deacetylase family protein [Bacteroidales bacterium]|nr:polysaccharide deacetylase family protein [Bacteroidales bacterium]
MSLITAGTNLFAQQTRDINKLLGYPAGTKLLIIHADDMGMSHSTNAAVIHAFETGSITSGSIMVPCPWFAEMAAWIKDNPLADVGIHSTLTAEWKYYRFTGVLPVTEIPSLIDKDGYFYPTLQQVAIRANPTEVEKELRAQINKAIAYGIKPTHLDNHMGSIYVTPEIFRAALRVARDYKLPLSLPMNLLEPVAPFLKNEIPPDMIAVDNFMMLGSADVGSDWYSMYATMISNLVPGLNEIVVHLSYHNDEMKAIAIDHEDFGSEWRQKDLDLVTSERFKKLLRDNNVKLITWRDIQQALYPE